ncbi:MAG: 50S ribosomal protein L29 [Pseudomonadota bacterium]
MKPVELRDKPVVELSSLEEKLEADIFQLKFKLGTGQLKQTSDIKKTKKDLARVKTFLRQKRNA